MNKDWSKNNPTVKRIRKTISITELDQQLLEEIKDEIAKSTYANRDGIKDSTVIQSAIRCYHQIYCIHEDLPFS